MTPYPFPSFYPIIDASVLASRNISVAHYAEALSAAGIELAQYRDKTGSPQHILEAATVLRAALPNATLIMNDRTDLAVLAGFEGVHVGQGDLLPEDAMAILDPETTQPSSLRLRAKSRLIVGVSTHTEEQVRDAHLSRAGYIAIGPVFATGTKIDTEPVVGLAGLRHARALTSKPLIAIGGITRENTRSVLEAGADSVAVISALFVQGENLEKVARDFLELLR